MNSSVVIKDQAIFHPETEVDNSFFLEHFKEQGKDIEPLINFTGRSKRYIDPTENSLSMAIKSSTKALEKAGISAEDLDMIVYSSGTPEYVSPSNAIKIHQALGGKKSTIVYDLNANCVGMVIALEQVSRYMLSNPSIKYALLVGSEQMSRYSKPSDEVPYANFGDASCAVILERTQGTNAGFIDSGFYTDSSFHDTIVLPGCGFSKLYTNDTTEEERKMTWLPFDTNEAFLSAKRSIEELLDKNNLSKSDVKKYFLSQFARGNIENICNQLEEDSSKFAYTGDEFGYTGTSSPFIAMTKTIENEEIQRGDVIVFWSVGAGITCCNVIYRY